MVLVISGALAYSSALSAPFVYDDVVAIERNPTIRTLSPVSVPLSPPRDTPVAGRPLVNLSFALNYAVNDGLGIDQDPRAEDPRRVVGYHIVSVALHCLAAMLLFAIVRRTAESFSLAGLDSEWIAGSTALLWLLHPIQSEAVDYVTQRTEVLASLLYLATLYASIRAWDAASSRNRRSWEACSVLACAAGMLSKEIVITAPIVVLLYDRVFLARSWAAITARRERLVLYGMVFATALIVVASTLSGVRRHSVGFNLGISWQAYLATQAWAIARYLRLLILPVGLTFDYGDAPASASEVVVGALVLLPLVVAIVICWRRAGWQWLAFAGIWFFVILLPSSSVIPIRTEIAAERRVYLASAGLIAAAIVGLAVLARRTRATRWPRYAVVSAAVLLGGCTFQRGLVFRVPARLYADVIAKSPRNPRGYVGLGLALSQEGRERLPEVRQLFERAVAVDSNSVQAWQSLGIAVLLDGDWTRATAAFRNVLRLDPGNLDADAGLARAFLGLQLPDSAATYVAHIGAADPEALWMLGGMYLERGRPRDAIAVLEKSASAFPAGPAAAMLSLAYARAGDSTSALQAAAFARTSGAQSADAFVFIGRALASLGHRAEAQQAFENALKLDTTSSLARAGLDSLQRRR